MAFRARQASAAHDRALPPSALASTRAVACRLDTLPAPRTRVRRFAPQAAGRKPHRRLPSAQSDGRIAVPWLARCSASPLRSRLHCAGSKQPLRCRAGDHVGQHVGSPERWYRVVCRWGQPTLGYRHGARTSDTTADARVVSSAAEEGPTDQRAVASAPSVAPASLLQDFSGRFLLFPTAPTRKVGKRPAETDCERRLRRLD